MIAWALSIIFLGYAAYLAWGRKGSHAAGIIWCAAWGAMLLLYRIFGGLYEYKAFMVLWTGIFCILFMVGFHASAFGIDLRAKQVGLAPARKYYDFKWIKIALIATTAVGMGAPVRFMATAGINLGRILNIVGYFDVIQDTHAQLVQGSLEQDLITKICLMVALAGNIIAGVYLGLGRPGRRASVAVCAVTLVPFIVMMALTTVRSLFVMPVVVMTCSYIAGMTVSGTEGRLFRFKPIAIGIVLTPVLAAFILVMQSIRLGDYQFQNVGATVAHMRPWVAGTMPALTIWYYKFWNHQLTWGALSFKGIVTLLGVRGEGFDTTFDQMQIGLNQTSNAMTCLRIFINDFGLLGAMVFGVIFGALAGSLSQWSRQGSIAAAILLSAILAAVVWAPNMWFLGYGTRLLSPFIALAYVLAFVRRANPPAAEARISDRPRIRVRVRTPVPSVPS